MSNGETSRDEDKLNRQIGQAFLGIMRAVAREESKALFNPPKSMEMEVPEVQVELMDLDAASSTFQTPVQDVQELKGQDLSQTVQQDPPARLMGVEELFPFPEYQEGESLSQHRRDIAHVATMRKEYSKHLGAETEIFVDAGEAPDIAKMEEFFTHQRRVDKMDKADRRTASPDPVQQVVDEVEFMMATGATFEVADGSGTQVGFSRKDTGGQVADKLNLMWDHGVKAGDEPPQAPVQAPGGARPPVPPPPPEPEQFTSSPPVLPPEISGSLFPEEPPMGDYTQQERDKVRALTQRPPISGTADQMSAEMAQYMASMQDALARLGELAASNRLLIEDLMNQKMSELC